MFEFKNLRNGVIIRILSDYLYTPELIAFIIKKKGLLRFFFTKIG